MSKSELGLEDLQNAINGINDLSAICFNLANERGWWTADELGTEKQIVRGKLVRLALVHSEVSEAVEAIRTDAMDKHLPHMPGEAVELADAMIRLLDYCGGHKINIGKAIAEKLAYNQSRIDHSLEHRASKGGKKV